ncbi:MAG TPA: ABC transporter permease [Candidatus Bathyarchaeia archaeon]
MEWLVRALYIAWKDVRVYYLKAPNLTYGLMMPVALYLAFGVTGQMNPGTLISGLVSLVILFGTMSIEAVAVVMEKQTRTMDRLMAAPVSPLTIVLGKALAGTFLGPLIAAAVLLPLTLYSGESIGSPILVFLAIILSSFTFSALGVLVSSYARWVPEAQMYANFLRFPMAFLSGTFVPLEAMPPWLQTATRVLPLTYSVEALRSAMGGGATPTYILDMMALALFSAAVVAASALLLERSRG